jgi:hypothetical protein
MTDQSQPTGEPSYLDHPELALVIDPADLGADPETVIADLLARDPADTEIIVRGAAMLSAAGAGTAAECLATSMTWRDG